MHPATALFSRQQLGSLAGLDDTTLNYWSREGLLIPSAGGLGRGSHRKFDFVQVNIAAVLGQLRRFGLSIALMRSLAELLQSAARLGASRELHPGNYSTAARLADKLSQFRSGVPVLVRAHDHAEEPPLDLKGRALSDWWTERRPATTDADVIKDILGSRDDYDPLDAIIAMAEKIGPGRSTEARIYADLVFDVLAPGYSDAYSWLLGVDTDASWRIEFGSEGKFFEAINGPSPEDFGPGIFLPVSGIIRKVWVLKTPLEHRRGREAEHLKKQLADLGIEATITINENPEEGFNIDAPDAEGSVLDIALDKLGYRWATVAGDGEDNGQ
jgi:DNA-binding transcriptional MerR regulator